MRNSRQMRLARISKQIIDFQRFKCLILELVINYLLLKEKHEHERFGFRLAFQPYLKDAKDQSS
jgi:hypothetical protein